jgi:hypothetical protein
MTESRCRNRVATMAELFLQTCPNDWNSGWGPFIHGCLRAAIAGEAIPDEDIDVAALIAFRWELGQLADYIVQVFELPVPSNQACVFWNRPEWQTRVRPTIPGFDQRHVRVWQELLNGKFEPKPTPAQGPPFTRFSQYITAAVVEANLSQTRTLAVIHGLLDFMQSVKQFHQERIVKNAQVILRGRNWFKAIGRRPRLSLSPRKSED